MQKKKKSVPKMQKVKANWSGIVSIDINIEGNKIDDKSMGRATQMLKDELTAEIKDAIYGVCSYFPDGGEVQISDVCIDPFHLVRSKE